MANYFNWKISLRKMVQYALFYGVPLLIFNFLEMHPAVASITIGTILTGIANYLKHFRK